MDNIEPPIYILKYVALLELKQNNCIFKEEELFEGVHTFTDEHGEWVMLEELQGNMQKLNIKPEEKTHES